jgi:REP element-mobilizing transposase RayT
MSKIVGYMVTWTTYGSWLPGDKRGYVDNGKTLLGDVKILERNRKRQKSSIVKLNAREKEIVKRTILVEAEKIDHKIEALSVYSNHIHLLARPHTESIEKLAGRYKSMTTRALWQKGRKGRIWTKGYDKRFCFSEEEIANRIKYVQNHNV